MSFLTVSCLFFSLLSRLALYPLSFSHCFFCHIAEVPGLVLTVALYGFSLYSFALDNSAFSMSLGVFVLISVEAMWNWKMYRVAA